MSWYVLSSHGVTACRDMVDALVAMSEHRRHVGAEFVTMVPSKFAYRILPKWGSSPTGCPECDEGER